MADENNTTREEREMAIPEQYSDDPYMPLWRCRDCGEPIPKRAKFCLECGRRMDWEHAVDLGRK